MKNASAIAQRIAICAPVLSAERQCNCRSTDLRFLRTR
jgi:hypothetical protein